MRFVKSLVLVAAIVVPGVAGAAALTGDAVTFSIPGAAPWSWTVKEGKKDGNIGNFRFDFDAGEDADQFLFTSKNKGYLGRDEITLSSLDFSDGEDLIGFEVLETVFENLTYKVLDGTSITFFFDYAKSLDGNVLSGRFLTSGSAASEVPLPATAPLVLAGLGALAALRRRKRA